MIPRIKHYLSVSKKEWNGMVVMIILIALVLAAPFIEQANHKDNTINFKAFDKAANTAPGNAGFNADDTEINAGVAKRASLFRFNPNKLSLTEWVKLGLSPQQAQVIKHYQEKGGRFYTKGDVQKMYSINAETYKRLEPYIELPDGPAYRMNKAKPGEVIEVNTADSAKLTMIRGIGPAFARRIVRYRQRVGGFYSKAQLKEVYGIDEQKYKQIEDGVSVDGRYLIKVNINTAVFNDLKRFPYLSYKQMDAIIAYRDEHGNYRSVKDLENIAILNAQILRKIEPYLVFK
ncbi:competence ComEA-like helix-hairpin-helix protein [Mucilaginibacter oryzae]|uniref:Competence ComEA-like helix-hairpin-helix protein n=1 Tax=Mucilaginibacter oryzae TaxID=468058 RepID=A0A316HHA8_9SPHI|nr:helix-hairpin-helix domain-containing protein [Mucilaginibacter oryzae]PWK77635.1 competence ComEA-like helix-hairpin-helix protein [Mucilaginibacter oryzae]